MSIIIKGLEMPKETYAHCMLIKDIDGSVRLHVCTKNSEDLSEWEYYDLVPVPPHGRLIDADALMRHKGDCYDADGHLLYAVGTGNILCAPTIIEEER